MSDSTTGTCSPAEENWAAYRRGLEAGHSEYVAMATKCDNFVLSEQWDPVVKAKVEGSGRPALTINMVRPIVTAMIAQQTNTRADIIFKPRRNGKQEVADALTKQALQIQDNNKYPFVETQVFADGIIQDRGYFDIRMDFDDSLQGEIRITSEDPLDIIPDPGARDYDPKTWQEITKTRWLTPMEVALLYGKDKADEVRIAVATDDTLSSDEVKYVRKTFGDVDPWLARAYGDQTKDIRRVRMIERQYYKLTRLTYFVDPNTGDMREVPSTWDAATTTAVAQEFGLETMKRLGKRIRWTVSTCNVELHDDWSPYKTYTIVPYFPFFRRGRPVGVVRDLLDPQEQFNKIESQQLHVVNTTANSGWLVETGSLANMDTDELERRGAETGLVIEYNHGRNSPEKIQPNQVPSGLDRLGAKVLNNLREISGVSSLLGLESDSISGVALDRKRQGGLNQLQVPLDNLTYTRHLVAEKILELVQQFYTETRVIRTTNWEDPARSQEETIINGVTPEGEIFNDVTLGEYDVVVSSAPARDTFEESQFAEAIQLRDAGVMIPDHHIVMKSHLADKLAIAEELKQMQGLGEQTPEQVQLAEMQMQMQIEMANAALQEAQAKVRKLEAEAELYMAKAQNEGASADLDSQRRGLEVRLELEQMRADLAKRSADLQNKLELARMHIQAKLANTMYTETSRRIQKQAEARKPQRDKTAA